MASFFAAPAQSRNRTIAASQILNV